MPIRTSAAFSAITLSLLTAACGPRETVATKEMPVANAASPSSDPAETQAPNAISANDTSAGNAAAAETDLATLAGAWRVAGVAPGDGI